MTTSRNSPHGSGSAAAGDVRPARRAPAASPDGPHPAPLSTHLPARPRHIVVARADHPGRIPPPPGRARPRPVDATARRHAHGAGPARRPPVRRPRRPRHPPRTTMHNLWTTLWTAGDRAGTTRIRRRPSTPARSRSACRPRAVHVRDTRRRLRGRAPIHTVHTAYYCYWIFLFRRSFEQQAWGWIGESHPRRAGRRSLVVRWTPCLRPARERCDSPGHVPVMTRPPAAAPAAARPLPAPGSPGRDSWRSR